MKQRNFDCFWQTNLIAIYGKRITIQSKDVEVRQLIAVFPWRAKAYLILLKMVRRIRGERS
jgi:hypothetical protein